VSLTKIAFNSVPKKGPTLPYVYQLWGVKRTWTEVIALSINEVDEHLHAPTLDGMMINYADSFSLFFIKRECPCAR
jgi:hypothetical protein